MDQYLTRQRGATSCILRVKIRDTSDNNGAGKTGLAFNTASLIISTIADNEATPTTYTSAGSTIETISTLGTYAAPTATKIRFKEVDSTNHPGLYELQIANARMAVSGAKSLTVTIVGAADAEQTDVEIDLTSSDNMVGADAVALSGDTAAADNAESYFDGTGYADVLQRTTIATLASQTSFTLTAGSSDNDAYNGCTIVFQDASTAAQKAVGVISDYVGSTKTVTLVANPAVFTVAASDIVTILPPGAKGLDGATVQLNGNTFKGTATLTLL